MALTYVKPTILNLKGHPQITEKWIQERIAEDPSILGLGDVELRAVEKMQPRAGRLDLLLHNTETDQRYEVELMLGALDESHIIRTIEYWDIERKRYPQYEHYAVIVAEDITSRFLNVIGLLNGGIPLIAIQLTALQLDDKIMLIFTKIVDEVVRGDDEEDDTPEEKATDRNYWEKKNLTKSLAIVDECMGVLHSIAPGVNPNYRQNYIGLRENDRANNFISFFPKVSFLRVRVRIAATEEWTKRLEDAGIEVFENRKRGRIEFRLNGGDTKKHESLLKEFFAAAYREQED